MTPKKMVCCRDVPRASRCGLETRKPAARVARLLFFWTPLLSLTITELCQTQPPRPNECGKARSAGCGIALPRRSSKRTSNGLLLRWRPRSWKKPRAISSSHSPRLIKRGCAGFSIPIRPHAVRANLPAPTTPPRPRPNKPDAGVIGSIGRPIWLGAGCAPVSLPRGSKSPGPRKTG